jgi:hypothetical protein
VTSRRRHFRIEELGVEQLVSELLARGLTYEEIAERMKADQGVDVSKSSIARYNATIQRKLRDLERTRQTAEALAAVMKKEGNEPDTQMSDMLVATMQCTILDRIADGEVTNKELVGLTLAGSQAIRAKASLETLKTNERARQARAWDLVLQKSRELLQSSGLWQQVEAVLLEGRASALEE